MRYFPQWSVRLGILATLTNHLHSLALAKQVSKPSTLTFFFCFKRNGYVDVIERRKLAIRANVNKSILNYFQSHNFKRISAMLFRRTMDDEIWREKRFFGLILSRFFSSHNGLFLTMSFRNYFYSIIPLSLYTRRCTTPVFLSDEQAERDGKKIAINPGGGA